jgi:uncharacterized membrane protein
VSGANGIFAGLNVSFEVTATYGIELGQTETLIFDEAILGYGAQAAKTITISNNGNQPTENLTLSVSNGDFTLAPTTIANIAVGGSTDFTVVPALGLSAGTHTATVTVSGGSNIEEQSFEVSFEVTATYGIELGQTETLIFDEAILGYGAQGAKTVDISNTGDQSTGNLTLSVSNGDFVLAPTTIANIAVGGSADFTVVPALGLSAGTHTATVTVSGGSNITAQSFNVSFYVIAATYGVTLSETAAHTFPEAIFGYPAQGALSVTISNSGNQPTGALTVSAGTDFEVTTPANGAVTSIPVGDEGAFSVRPKTGLGAGPHSATVTVSGNNGITAQSFGVSFVVIAATYGVALSETGTYPFPDAKVGYGTQPAKTITITNSGNQPTGALSVALGGTNGGSFTRSPATIPGIAVNDTATFTVTPPAPGLAIGTYTATVSVTGGNGISAEFNVSFAVTPPSYLKTTNGTIVQLGAGDLGALCVYSSAENSSITVSGQSIGRNTIKKVAIGGSEFAGVTALSDYFCYKFSNLTELDLSGLTGLTSISSHFMSECTSFNQTLVIPEGVKNIGTYFMDDCTAFNQPLTLPSTLTGIGGYFMNYCYAFNQQLTLPATITSIGDSFLYHCILFNRTLVIPNGVTGIGSTFLGGCAAFNQPLTIPSTVTGIGVNFLISCYAFNRTLTLPSTLTSINSHFMNNCTAFNQTLTLPSALTSIGPLFLSGSDVFNQPLVIPEGVTRIAFAFLSDCKAFNQPLVIPEGVTSIEQMFLLDCDSLVSTITVRCPATAFQSTYTYSSFAATNNAEADCYTTGITIAGPYTADIIAKFPSGVEEIGDRTFYRKLIAAQ